MSSSSLSSGQQPTLSSSVRADGQTQHTSYQPSVLGSMPLPPSTNASPYQVNNNNRMPSGSWLGGMAPPLPQEGIFPPPNENGFPPATSFAQDNNFDMQGYGLGSLGGGVDLGGSFQQPFVPQDLWQMPMTLEWDWADFFGTGPGFDLNDPNLGVPP
jgi:hypothetical protein